MRALVSKEILKPVCEMVDITEEDRANTEEETEGHLRSKALEWVRRSNGGLALGGCREGRWHPWAQMPAVEIQ